MLKTKIHFSPLAEQKISSWNLGRLFLLIEETAYNLFYPLLKNQIQNIPFLVLPSTQEKLKSLHYYEKVIQAMVEYGMNRDSCLIAVGGGSLLDMAGFVASTYARGISFVSIPTTFLAMIDACLGGKTALNFSDIKNVIGTTYPATHIIIDPHCLSSLPPLQMQSGLAEVIKYALIADPSLFTLLENNKKNFWDKDPLFLEKIIHTSLAIKHKIVLEDPLESGLRRSLNFGHTLGHALEAFWKHTLPHGHAIAIGMILESYLSLLTGLLSQEELLKICSLCKEYGFLSTPVLPSYEELKPFLHRDKKNAKGMIRSTLLCAIGKVDPAEGHYCSSLSEDLIKKSLIWYKSLYENLKTTTK